MKAEESALRPLLEGTTQYQVPLYQRRYAWTHKEWEALWKAVRRQYDFALNGPVDVQSHFLGSFVFAPVPGMAASPAIHRVVDGQQRITTLMLLLSAIRDLRAEEDPAEWERFNDYLLNRWKSGDEKYKLIPSPHDRPAFFAIIAKQGSPSPSSPITAAYRYFRNELRKAQLDQELDLLQVETVTVDRVWVVEISTSGSDNVHRIFQTLNSSGVALDQVDLLRNHFFMLLPTLGEEAYESYWRALESELGLRNLDYFLWADLISQGKAYEGLARQGVYAAWQQRLELCEHDEAIVLDHLKKLLDRARVYRRMLEPSLEPSDVIRRGLERTAEWQTSVQHPLILKVLLDHHTGLISEQSVAECLHLLESYLVRRLLAKVPTNNLNRIFTTTAASLGDTAVTPDALRKVLSSRGNYWPSDEEIFARTRSEEFYRAQQPPQRQFILRRLEEHFSPVEVVNWKSCSFTIEHVMPQTLSEDWYSYLEESGDNPVQTHAELLHTIGNVTLTCFNPALSNSPLERKQQILGNSPLKLNLQIAETAPWNREAILSRSRRLAEIAVAIWAAPLPLESGGPDEATMTLEAAVSSIPAGSWTTYSALAELTGIPTTEVMGYLRMHPTIEGVQRVARTSGAIDTQAPWASVNIESYMQLLAGEGVLGESAEGPRLVDQFRLDAEELAALLGAS